MKSSIQTSLILLASLLALFFACQMSRGDQHTIWPAEGAALEDIPTAITVWHS